MAVMPPQARTELLVLSVLWGGQCLQDAYEAFEDAHGWNTHAAGNHDDDNAAGYSTNQGTGHGGAGFFLKRTFSGGFGGSDQATGGGSGNGSSTGAGPNTAGSKFQRASYSLEVCDLPAFFLSGKLLFFCLSFYYHFCLNESAFPVSATFPWWRSCLFVAPFRRVCPLKELSTDMMAGAAAARAALEAGGQTSLNPDQERAAQGNRLQGRLAGKPVLERKASKSAASKLW